MRLSRAFTLIELVFVIVIMGIIGKFGVEFLAQAYKGFIFTSVNNNLQNESEMAVELIGAKLQYRIKDSIIARASDTNFTALGSASDDGYKILEWVGADADGVRGNSDDNITIPTFNKPNWSGIIDLDDSNATTIVSPETNTTKINALISALSYGTSDINKSALYFVGSSSDAKTGYGWDAFSTGAITDQNQTMHPINSSVTDVNQFISPATDGNFSEVYEYYKLAWTAYAIVHTKDGIDNNLTLYYDYQPWNGETYHNGKSALIMQNVDTFRFMAIGSLVKIQICVDNKLVEDYSLCKEKTIY